MEVISLLGGGDSVMRTTKICHASQTSIDIARAGVGHESIKQTNKLSSKLHH